MSFSRRQFLQTSVMTASVPLIGALAIEDGYAGVGNAVDMTLGYTPHALRMDLNENSLGNEGEITCL